jgi:aspartokinase
MSILGPLVSAGLFTNHALAEEAWDALVEAGIPATVVTDPGILGEYSVSVEVERDDLDRAIVVLRERVEATEDPEDSGE